MISAFFKANPVLAWLLSAIVVVAAGTGFYYLSQTYRDGGGEQVAALPTAEKSDRPSASGTPQADTPEAVTPVEETPEEQTQQVELAEPRFDVLRVEKDGSTVIAGTGPASSRVEVLSGGNVLAWTMSGPGGDFAIVFDEPLAPGDYELSLRAKAEDGSMVASSETGIVHVPASAGAEDAGGEEVIAMVTKEGEASRVLQAPGSAETVETPVASAQPSEESADEAGEQQVASAEPAPATEGETAAVTPADATEEASEEAAAEDTAAGETATEETASETPSETPAGDERAAQVDVPVLVKAVDVDGGKLFVAGSGQPGRSINIYLDGKFLGATTVGPEGGFLLETDGDIEAGTHEIRADMLADGSTDVTKRAVVPLIHEVPESGETQVAAAETPKPAEEAGSDAGTQPSGAQAPGTHSPGTQASEGSQSVIPVEESAGAASETVNDTASEPAGQTASAGEEAPASPVEEARQGSETATGGETASGGETTVASETPAAAEGEAPATETAAAESKAVDAPAPGGEGVVQSGQAPVQTADQTAGQPAGEASQEMASKMPGETAGNAADAPASADERMALKSADEPAMEQAGKPTQEMAAADTPDAEAKPKPIRTGANVIIRRGDNLWRISRRMLGSGIKYTVIYEANRDQIRDPHWIYPGQVFDVPGAEPDQG